MRGKILYVLSFLQILSGSIGDSQARDVSAEEVTAIDGKIACFSQRNWFITTVTGPCDNFGAPSPIRRGESFSAGGKTRKIGVLIASEAEKDMLTYGMDIRKGEWTCVAAETANDLPSDDSSSRTWLYIRKCQLIR
jgi:hypothetical protein